MKSRRVFWEEHIFRCKNAGANQKEYCRSNSLNYNTFKYWQHKLKKENVNEAVKGFIEIPVKDLQSEIEIKISLSNGITISVNPEVDTSAVRNIIESLKGLS